MLANNIVRINGYIGNKRTHTDIEVPMEKIEFYNSAGEKFSILAPRIPYDIAQVGFDNGLDGVTSYNAWNWVGKHRITQQIV